MKNRYFFRFATAVAALTLLMSCSDKSRTDGAVRVRIDAEDVTVIDPSDDGIMERAVTIRQDGEAGLLGYVKNFLMADGNFYIHTDDRLHVFDQITGDFRGSVANPGRGPGEYVDLNYVWMRSDTLFIQDINGDKILLYSPDGTFLDEMELPDGSFIGAAPLGDGYVGTKIWRGSVEESYELAYYDSLLAFVQNIGETRLKSGVHFGRSSIAAYGDEVLYWRPLGGSAIYAIDGGLALREKYTIDFGEYNFGRTDRFEDDYAMLDYVNGYQGKMATLITDVVETDEYLSFGYTAFNGNQPGKRLCIYDKTAGRAYSFIFGSDVSPDFFPMPDGKVYVIVVGDEYATISVYGMRRLTELAS